MSQIKKCLISIVNATTKGKRVNKWPNSQPTNKIVVGYKLPLETITVKITIKVAWSWKIERQNNNNNNQTEK